MSLGFFERTPLPTVGRVHALPQCGKCKLDRGCQSPKMKVAGDGRRKIVVVGEAPGRTEDERGVPFVGDAGQRLQRTLRRHGIDIFKDCWVVNSVSCRPPQNKLPPQAVDFCRPLVIRAIEERRPRVVLLLGGMAVKSVIGHLLKTNDPGGSLMWSGYRIPLRHWDCWLLPANHPSWLLRMHDNPVADAEFDAQVRAASKYTQRPSKAVGFPDYESMVVSCVDDDEAFRELGSLDPNAPVAFDYETTTKRPHAPGAEIVCCAMSDGKKSVSFLWRGKARKLAEMILKSPQVPKVAQNSKFEAQWSSVVGGFRVRGWDWDTMTAAHAIDFRPGVTALEFQCFARLGLVSHKS